MVEQAPTGAPGGGVLDAAPEVEAPFKAVEMALRGEVGRGQHRMGGPRGYLESLENASWSFVSQGTQ